MEGSIIVHFDVEQETTASLNELLAGFEVTSLTVHELGVYTKRQK